MRLQFVQKIVKENYTKFCKRIRYFNKSDLFNGAINTPNIFQVLIDWFRIYYNLRPSSPQRNFYVKNKIPNVRNQMKYNGRRDRENKKKIDCTEQYNKTDRKDVDLEMIY